MRTSAGFTTASASPTRRRKSAARSGWKALRWRSDSCAAHTTDPGSPGTSTTRRRSPPPRAQTESRSGSANRRAAAGAWVAGFGSRIELEALLERKLIRIASPWRRSGLGILGNNETFLKSNYSDSKIQLIPTSTNMTDSPILRACMNLNPCTKFNQF